MYYPTLPKIMLTKSVKKLITVNRKKCLPQVERTPYRGWKRVITVPEKKVLDFCNIDGEKELREINAEYIAGMVKG